MDTCHRATLAEIEMRFGSDSEFRRVQFESLVWLAEAAAMCDVQRIVINGSFVRHIVEPNDVDCLLLVGDEFKMEGAGEQWLIAGFPFLDLQFVNAEEFREFIDIYASDREAILKGVVELIR